MIKLKDCIYYEPLIKYFNFIDEGDYIRLYTDDVYNIRRILVCIDKSTRKLLFGSSSLMKYIIEVIVKIASLNWLEIIDE